MYTTGELANITKISQRMIRHYDKIGLLKPTIIKENGYRYYDDAAIIKVGRITQLRRYQLSLNAIREILDRDDNEFTSRILKEQAAYFRQNNSEQSNLILEIERQIRAMKNADFFETMNKHYDILIGYRNDMTALCLRKVTTQAYITTLIDQLIRHIEADDILIQTGPQMSMFYDSFEYDLEAMDVEVGVPVNTESESHGDFYTRTIKGGLYISTMFLGSYDLIGEAYYALMNWAEQNNYCILGGATEKYYKDYRDTSVQDAFVTEICFPVESRM